MIIDPGKRTGTSGFSVDFVPIINRLVNRPGISFLVGPPFSVLGLGIAPSHCPICDFLFTGVCPYFPVLSPEGCQQEKYWNAMASDYDEQSTQSKQRVTTIVMAVLAIVFLCLRLLARRVKKIHLGADDVTLIVGLVSLPLFLQSKISGGRV